MIREGFTLLLAAGPQLQQGLLPAWGRQLPAGTKQAALEGQEGAEGGGEAGTHLGNLQYCAPIQVKCRGVGYAEQNL